MAERVRPGDHACLLSADPALRAEVVAGYLRDGLARGEQAVLATGDAGPVLALLRRDGVDVETEKSRGALRLPEAGEVYQCDTPGGFQPRAVLERIADATEKALQDGFSGVRFSGESPPALDDPLMPAVLDYEAALDRRLCSSEAAVLCVYDTSGWPALRAAGVLQAHPLVIRDGAAWQRNVLYRPRHAARVLVMEDDDDGGESLSLVLEMLGHHCRRASDGASALETARAWWPELIIADLRLPSLDGHRLARAVRNDAALAHTPMIALSGLTRDSDREAALRAGFDLHLVKPASPEQLRAVLADPQRLRPRRS